MRLCMEIKILKRGGGTAVVWGFCLRQFNVMLCKVLGWGAKYDFLKILYARFISLIFFR